jgi:hypothetical protein
VGILSSGSENRKDRPIWVFSSPAYCVCRLTASPGDAPAGQSDGPQPIAAGEALLISEFRVRGPAGGNDEFIETYNNSTLPHTVTAASGTGYGIPASDGVTRCSIPDGTVIPPRGHYLCVNSVAYSIGAYPAGNGATATGNATYVTDIPDNAGIALFNNNTGGGAYTLGNRFDAVGSAAEAMPTTRKAPGIRR